MEDGWKGDGVEWNGNGPKWTKWNGNRKWTLFIAFAIYVDAEKEIDRVSEIALQSHSLASELRQSSDDLANGWRARM